MKKFVFVSLALIVFTLAAAQESLACSCIALDVPEKQQVLDAYNNSTAVFSGEVLDVKRVDERTNTVTLKLIDSWKWAFGDTVTVTTASDSAMCGYEFVVGKTYLVYGDRSSDKILVSNCSRTRVFDPASKDLKYLKKYKQKRPKKA